MTIADLEAEHEALVVALSRVTMWATSSLDERRRHVETLRRMLDRSREALIVARANP